MTSIIFNLYIYIEYINNKSKTIDNPQLGEYFISTDKSLRDVKLIHTFFSTNSYWTHGRP